MKFGWYGKPKKFCHVCGEDTEYEYQNAVVEMAGVSFDMIVPVCKQCGNEVGMPKSLPRYYGTAETVVAKA